MTYIHRMNVCACVCANYSKVYSINNFNVNVGRGKKRERERERERERYSLLQISFFFVMNFPQVLKVITRLYVEQPNSKPLICDSEENLP